MSGSSTPAYSPTTDRDFWVNMEVPYGLYHSNWDSEHKDRLCRLVDQSNLLKRHFEPHWKLHPKITSDMSKKNLAINSFCSSDKDWAVSILCAYNFARNTSAAQVIDCLQSALLNH